MAATLPLHYRYITVTLPLHYWLTEAADSRLFLIKRYSHTNVRTCQLTNVLTQLARDRAREWRADTEIAREMLRDSRQASPLTHRDSLLTMAIAQVLASLLTDYK